MISHLHFRIRIMFTLFLVCAFGYGVYESLGFMKLARYFPLCVSSICFLLSVVQLFIELKSVVADSGNREKQKVDLSTDWDIPLLAVMGKALIYLGYLIVFYILIYLVGLRLAAVLGMFLFYRFRVRFPAWKALALGLCGWLFLVVIARLLAVRMVPGLLHEFVELPKAFF
jgi:hypothetical protein